MSDFYTGLRDTAANVIADKGRALTLHKRTPAAYAPSSGTASVTETDYSCTGAVLNFPATLIDGTLIQRGDRKIILSARGLTVEPDDGDTMTIGTKKVNIIAVKPVAPDGTVVIYILQVRG